MVSCLNGQSGAVQPYKDLFDSMDEKDLATLLEIFNRHFFSNPQRRNQSLDVISKLHNHGDLAPLMNGLTVAAENKVIENAASLTLKVLNSNEPDLSALKKFFVDLIDNQLFGQGVISLADHFGGINGRSLGLIFAAASLTAPNSMTSDRVVDLLVSELNRSLDDGSFLKVLSALKDSSLQPSSLSHALDPQERNDLAQYLSSWTRDSARFLELLNMAKVGDHSVSCFKKGPQYLTTDSLSLSLGRELLKRSPGPQIDRFFLQTLPLDISTVKSSCNFPPGLVEVLKVDQDEIRAGYGNGKRAIFKALMSTKDTKSEFKFIESEYFLQAGPIFTEISRRGAYPFALNLLGQDVTPTDSMTLSQIIERSEATGVQENIVRVLRTLLSQDLHPLGQALVKSMGDTRGGLGDILGTFASGVSLSSSNPFQDALRELLRDEDLMNRLRPIFISMLGDPRLPSLINFSAKLAANGQLEKIIVFLAEILKTQGLPGLSGPALSNSFLKPTLATTSYIQQVERGMPPLVPTQKYFECKYLEGNTFDNGASFYSGLQCLSSEDSYPQLSKITMDLKNLSLLDDASFTLKSMVELSPHFVGAMNQLESLEQSKELGLLFKLYSLAAENPYILPSRLDGILQDAFVHKETPRVLKSAGRILKMGSFTESGQALIDVVSQPPKKLFQSQTDFRLHLKNEAAVRAQIASWYPSLPPDQIEAIFQVAKENFETHNKAWMTHEGSYSELSETQWRQEIFSFFESVLRTTDVKEIILALQEIAKKGRLYEMLSQTIENQRVVLHYFGDGSTVPHIMTDWDQIEELMQDANFQYAGFHVALKFEQLVVNSAPMSVIEFLGKRGAEFTSLGHGKPNPHYVSEWTHFQNMIQNFAVLDEIEKNGQIEIFRTLYRGLQNATPFVYRAGGDVKLNHMAGLFHLNNIGFFEQATMAMASMQSQGKLQLFINNILGTIQLLENDDIQSIRQIIYNLVNRAKAGDTAPLDLIFNKLETAQNNKEGYQDIKDTLFHIFPALNQLGVRPSGLVKAVATITGHPQVFSAVFNRLIADSETPDGDGITFFSNILRLNPNGLLAFRKLGAIILLNDPSDGVNPLGSTSVLLSDLYLKHPDEFTQVRENFVAYLNDPRVKALNPASLFRNILGELKNQQGVGSLVGDLLVDPVSRGRAISLGSGLAKDGDFAQLSQFFDYLINSGDFEGFIHFIFDSFSPSSITSSKWATLH